MARQIAQRVYDLYGRFYDGVDFFFKRRLARAIRHISLRQDDHVLDIGVGTGLSLDFYPPAVHVTGLDLSRGMLAQAQRKLDAGQIRQGARARIRLVQGDAMALPFADGVFDCVFMSHVVATVPDPHRAMREAFRVARDRASIVLVNHFRNRIALVSWVETAIDPLCRKLGWRCDLSLRGLLGPLGVADPRPAFGHVFQTVYLQKRGDRLLLAAPAEQPALDPALEPL